MSSAALSWKQTKTFTLASIKSRYRNTVAGFIWVICGPLLIYGVQGYVFSTILKIDYNNYLLFLMAGLLPWIFFQQSISMSTTLIFNQARLLKSFPIHPLTSIVALILDNLINFTFTFTAILIFLLVAHPNLLDANFLIFIPALFSLLIWTVAIGWILSVLQVFFYDTKFVMEFGMNILFYLTPIFYPVKMVPENFRWIVEINPLGIILAPFQSVAHPESEVSVSTLLLKSFLVSFAALVIAFFVWTKKKNALYFKL